jgi:hypothetical protein
VQYLKNAIDCPVFQICGLFFHRLPPITQCAFRVHCFLTVKNGSSFHSIVTAVVAWKLESEGRAEIVRLRARSAATASPHPRHIFWERFPVNLKTPLLFLSRFAVGG